MNPYPDALLSKSWRVATAWVEPVYSHDLLPYAGDEAPFETARSFKHRIVMKSGAVLEGEIPDAMLTDGTSVPRALRWYADDNSGRHLSAAMLHDWLFVAWQQLEPVNDALQRQRFKFANAVFYHAMRAAGVRRTKAWLMWFAVHRKGWSWFIDPDGKLFA